MTRYASLFVVLIALALPQTSSGNGWKPKFTPDGKLIVSGAAVLTVTDAVTNVSRDVMLNGWEPDPCDHETVLYNGAQNGLRLLNLRTGEDQQLDPRELIELACTRTPQRLFWAARDVQQNAVVSSVGHVIPNAGQPTISDGGFFGFRTGDDRIEPFACDQGLVWHDLRGQVFGFFLDHQVERHFTVPGRQEYRPVCIATPAGMWILAMTPTGFLLHPAGGTDGYPLETGDNRNLNAHAVWVNGEIRAVFNDNQGALLRWTVRLSDPRVDLRGTPSPPAPAPGPPPPPPPPQACGEIPAHGQAALRALWTRPDVNALVRSANDDDRRKAARMFAEQMAFTVGPEWGTKNAGGWRPPSKDAIAKVVNGTLCGWDLVNGITRELVFGHGEPLPGQEFIPVTPTNHLGTSPPSPPNCDACQQENARLKAEIHALRSLLTETEIERDRLKAEVAAAGAQLATVTRDRDELKQQLEEASKPVTCQLVGQQRIFGVRIGGRCEAVR